MNALDRVAIHQDVSNNQTTQDIYYEKFKIVFDYGVCIIFFFNEKNRRSKSKNFKTNFKYALSLSTNKLTKSLKIEKERNK